MGNPNKAKGTRAETEVVRYLQAHGIEARREVLHGNKDHGDIHLEKSGEKFIAEVKTGKQTYNYSRSQLLEWLRQTEEEAINAGTTNGVLVIKRYQRMIDDAEVWWTRTILGKTTYCMTWLSEWVKG